MKIKTIFALAAMCVCLFSMEARAEVSFPESDGQNGYYKTSPEVVIKHTDEGIMRYRFEDANGQVVTGRLDATLRTITIQKGVMKDGTNTLDVWMEDEKGNVVDSSMERVKFFVDQTPPEAPLQSEQGETIQIVAKDNISGIAGIYYALEGKEMQYLKGEKVFFALPQNYEGIVSAYAVDQAGNQSEMCQYEIIKEVIEEKEPEIVEEIKDEESPQIMLEGVENTRISAEEVMIACEITDNQKISSLSGTIKQTLQDGTEVLYEITEWKKSEKGYQFQRELTEDGIYQIEIKGSDEAGNEAVVSEKLIIDMQPPYISKLNAFEDKRMLEFVWDYKADDVISDLTSSSYVVRIDGKLYEAGRIFKEEGRHILEVTAKDLAGNESREEVAFIIYKEREPEAAVQEIDEVTEEILLSEPENTAEVEEEVEIREERREFPTEAIVIGGISCAGLAIILWVVVKKSRSK